MIIQVVSVPTPRKRSGAVQQEGALCLWEESCRERHGWGWSLLLFVSRSKQKGRKSTNLNWKKWNLNICYICDMSALHFGFLDICDKKFSYISLTTFMPKFFFQAIFNHMGPNMARGWQGDSAGTKVIIFSFFLYLFRCPQLLLQSDLLFLLFDFYNFLLLRWSLKGGNLTTELHKY